MKLEFRKLNSDEILVRGQNVKKNGAVFLIYKDARVDMNILDETVGAGNWQRDHKEIAGVVYCGISIWDEEKNQWITKWDAGAEFVNEVEKGSASDSFKRAGFNWGIGRELYTAPFIWIRLYDTEVEEASTGKCYLKSGTIFTVSKISYIGNVISELVIVDKNGDVRFNWSLAAEAKKQTEAKENPALLMPPTKAILQELNSLGGTLEMVATYLKKPIEELCDADVRKVVQKKRERLGKGNE